MDADLRKQQHGPFTLKSPLSTLWTAATDIPKPRQGALASPDPSNHGTRALPANLIHSLGWGVGRSPQLRVDSQDLKDLGHLLLLLLTVVGHLSEHHL